MLKLSNGRKFNIRYVTAKVIEKPRQESANRSLRGVFLSLLEMLSRLPLAPKPNNDKLITRKAKW